MMALLLGGLIIGVTLGILGSGGSVITVPLLIYVVGEPAKIAIAESLLIVGAIAVVGAWRYQRAEQVVWSVVWRFGVPSMVGTYLGAWLSQRVSGDTQMLIFAVVMLVASRLMVKPVFNSKHTEARAVYLLPVAIMVGLLAGLVGVGGGFLIVPALVVIVGLSMRQAVGTSLCIIVLQSAVGAAKYLYLFNQQGETINLHIVLTMAMIGAAGSLIGGNYASRLPQQTLKRAFGITLVLMAGFIVINYTLPQWQ